MNMKKALRHLTRQGFRLEYGSAVRIKVIPPNPDLPFYSLHAHGGTKAEKPFYSFARKHWNITL